jgi:hypothetical protein
MKSRKRPVIAGGLCAQVGTACVFLWPIGRVARCDGRSEFVTRIIFRLTLFHLVASCADFLKAVYFRSSHNLCEKLQAAAYAQWREITLALGRARTGGRYLFVYKPIACSNFSRIDCFRSIPPS